MTVTLPVTQAERPEASLLATGFPSPTLAFPLISGSDSARFNVISDSLGDGQFFPKLLASVWSGTFWPHRRASRGGGALTSALPARFSRARTWGSENCFLQRGPEGSLVEGCRRSVYFLIPLPGPIREMLNLSKNSVSHSQPSFSTQLPPSALLSILSGVTTATSRTG